MLEPGTNKNEVTGNDGKNNAQENKTTKIETDLSNTEILTVVDNPDYNL